MLKLLFPSFFKEDKHKKPPPPTTRPKMSKPATILASRNLASFVDDYVTTTKAKQNIRKAIARKNPSKSYGEIYSNLYDFSYYVTFLCHCISFMLALSFGAIFVQQFGQTVLGFAVAVALSYIIAAVALGAMEWGQNTSLDTLFNVKFLTGRLPSGILVLCLGLSAISIVSSTYSMSFLFADNPLFAQIGVGISLINELGIISLSYWRHAYEFKSEQEANLLNDLTHNFDYNNLFYQQNQQSHQALPINYNPEKATPTIEIQEGTNKIVKPSRTEIEKFGLFKQEKSPVKKIGNTKKKPSKTAPKTGKKPNGNSAPKPNIIQVGKKERISHPSPTPKTGDLFIKKASEISSKKQGEKIPIQKQPKRAKTASLTVLNQNIEVEVWTKNEVRNFQKSYERKIADEGKTFTKVAHAKFFQNYAKNWKEVSDGKTAPKVAAPDRKKWFEENYPEISAKLKKTDSKKRAKKQ